MIAKVLLASGLLHFADAANAFEGFYSSPSPAQNSQTLYATQGSAPLEAPDASACIAAIAQAEQSLGLPKNLLLAIGLQEAGLQHEGSLTVWPWTINSRGVGYRFDTKKEAIQFARKELSEGRTSFDVGCMQINLKWHPDAFNNLEEAFDPFINANYAAQFVRRLRAQEDTWIDAASAYHSRTPEHRQRYQSGLLSNLQVAAKRQQHFETLAALSLAPPEQESRHTSRPTAFYNSLKSPHVDARRSRETELKSLRAIKPQASKSEAEQTTLTNGAWWTSELSSNGSFSQKRTIYSTEEIQPVLPRLISSP